MKRLLFASIAVLSCSVGASAYAANLTPQAIRKSLASAGMAPSCCEPTLKAMHSFVPALRCALSCISVDAPRPDAPACTSGPISTTNTNYRLAT